MKGQNQYAPILCNPLYTAYIATESKRRLSTLSGAVSDPCYSEEEVEQLLRDAVPSVLERPTIVARVKEAAVIAAYHKGRDYLVVQVLGCDDAPQVKVLTHEFALCWGHDGRFYKKLRPGVPYYVT